MARRKYGENKVYGQKYPYFALADRTEYGGKEAYGRKYPYFRFGRVGKREAS
ncbi:MAG: hypothetical protein IJ326_11650 [Lachnospiraceae bacterium]|nr:hypothetical protein [Lachnospiraceae bacterium]